MTKTETKLSTGQFILGEFFGGFSAMLVALPSAIAFGMIIFAPLGAEYAARGALAGILGAAVIGLVAPIFGGSKRLISSPCAPAAALLSVFAAEAVAANTIPLPMIPLYLALIGAGAGIIQIVAGIFKGGTFIKYIPYPVVTGYLSGVGILIFLSQFPKMMGIAKDAPTLHALLSPSLWQWQNIVIGVTTIAVMLFIPKILKAVPASIAALIAGIIVYFVIAIFQPSLLTLQNNHFVIGRIDASFNDIGSIIFGNIVSLGSVSAAALQSIIISIVSLGILLSIDTLKTCVVLDALSGSRHNSNRELFGQGVANICSATLGGVAGSGTMGGSLVNYFSGGRTRTSAIIEGISTFLVLIIFSRFISWIPIASLAGVLVVVAIRMIDWKSVNLLRHRSTVFDFAVILAVIIAAISVSLIAAAGVGIAFAIVLFLRDQIRFPVVRRKLFGNQVFSKRNRPPSEQAILEEKGKQTIIVELQGQLFFGTTDQLYTEVEPYFKSCRFFILDMRRILSVDFTAARMLSQLKNKIAEHEGTLMFTSIPQNLPTGLDVKDYMAKLGFVKDSDAVLFFDDITEALEFTEEYYLRESLPDRIQDRALELSEFDFFKGISAESVATLALHIAELKAANGEKIFSIGESGRELFFIKKGEVRIELPMGNSPAHHLATFVKGAFFGDMSFIDNEPRSADAVAVGEVHLFVLRRQSFDTVAENHPDVAGLFFERLSREISHRLRLNLVEIRSMD